MSEPGHLRHDKMKAHLRAATKHLAAQAAAAQASAQRHLDKQTVVAPAVTTTDTPTESEATPDVS